MHKPFAVMLVTAAKAPSHGIMKTLQRMRARVLAASSCRQARTLLAGSGEVDVVISDVSLPDGNWCSLLQHLVTTGSKATLLVNTSSHDERLWSEVVGRGGYDILVEPDGLDDAERVVEGAWRASLEARLQPA